MLKRNFIFFVICIAIVLALLFYVGTEKFYRNILNSDKFFLLIALLFAIFSIFIKVIRWYIIYKYKLIQCSIVYFIGQGLNQIAPIGTGELMRAYVGKSRLNAPVGKTIACVALERVMDTTLLFSTTLLLIFIYFPNLFFLQISFVTIILILAFILILKPGIVSWVIHKMPETKHPNFFRKEILLDSSNTFYETIKESLASLPKIFFLTFFAWLIGSVALFFLLISFQINLNFFYVFVILCASDLIGAFSFLPGGLGAKEVTFAMFLFFLGINFDLGLIVYIVWRGIACTILALGIAFSAIYPSN